MRGMYSRALLLLLVAAFAGACGPSGALAPLFDDDDGRGSTIAPSFNFAVPADGSAVAAVTTLGITGASLRRADFYVDGKLMARVENLPFEWVLDPADFVLGPHVIRLVATSSTGAGASTQVAITLQRAVSIEEIGNRITNLPPAFWYEVPNTRLRAVGWPDTVEALQQGIFRGQLADIMTGASGGAYDTERDRLIVFGGGGSYSGNEVYVYDFATAVWERLTDPSDFPPGDENNGTRSGAHPDDAPVSRHTFDYIEYIPPPVDRFFVPGGSNLYGVGQNIFDRQTYYLDFDLVSWSILPQDSPAGIPGSAAVAPDGRVWVHGQQNGSGLAVFDPSDETWTLRAPWPGFFNPGETAEIDPTRNLFVSVGNGRTRVWSLDNPEAGHLDLATTGDREIEAVAGPGLAYHPPSDRFVAWFGGSTVYTLDLDTLVWTKISGLSLDNPGAPTTRGVFGRFRYVPSKDVFIVVNDVDRNVFVYRLP